MNLNLDPAKPVQMSESERKRMSDFIEAEFGIRMPEQKRVLLEGRLAKRLRALKFDSYGKYFQYVTKDPAGAQEFHEFADLVSTHETNFFREPSHFDFLTRSVIPLWTSKPRPRPLRLLSSACSTGEEAYTMAMAVEEGFDHVNQFQREYEVEGVDLSENVVLTATAAIYPEAKTRALSQVRRERFFLRSKKSQDALCRVVPEIRRHARFHSGNLLGALNLRYQQYDIIFCRNVLIYFSSQTQRRVLHTLLAHLVPGGFLFLGHSESLMGLNVSGKMLGDAILRKD